MTGQTISHYKVLEKLGQGGMGVVYKATDTKLERTVVLKFLAPHLVQDEESRKRFVREAKAAAALDHTNICTVYEIDEAEGRTFLAMPYIAGQTLLEKVEQRPLKIDEAIELGIQIARGLAAAHHRGIVHRDIKSANIMIADPEPGSEPQAKIMDFGLAQLGQQATKLTKEGTTLGTAGYMSPEQAQGAPVDHRSDLWSLGVVLYEMVAGQLPFRGEYEKAVMYAILNEAPEPLTAVRTGVPKELEYIVTKALSKKPEDRYQHADDLVADLRRLRKERESGQTVAGAPAAPAKRSPTGLYLAGAAVLAAAIGVAAWLGVFTPKQERAAETMKAVPLTTYPGFERDPSFSPDGEQVVFSWDGENQDNEDIYVKRLDAPTPLRLTTDPAEDSSPVWSPDGRSIAFLRGRGQGKYDVLLTPAIGGPERKLTEMSGGWGLAWLPDGTGLVLTDRADPEEPASLFLLSMDTGEKQRLTSPPPGPWGDVGPAFSPDGRSLAFVRRRPGGTGDLYALALTEGFAPSGEPRRLTPRTEFIYAPAWSPDGRDVIFARGLGFRLRELVRIAASDPREPQPLAVAGRGALRPAVSPAKRRLVYSQTSSDFDLSRLDRSSTGSVWRPVSFRSSTRLEINPQYSPDGRRVAFASEHTGTTGIWLSDPDGSNATPLYIEGAFSGSPAWSPDGQRIAFDSNTGEEVTIWVINTSGGEPLRLIEDSGSDFAPGWSADGEWIYYTSHRTGRAEVWKVSAAGGEPIQITKNGGAVAVESPDGRFLYYLRSEFLPMSGESDLWRMPAAGGEESLVVKRVYSRNFAVFDHGIYFMQRPAEDDRGAGFAIRFLDLKTGAVSTVTTLDPSIRPFVRFTVSPDEKSIIYATEKQTGADLMLVENFR